MILPGIRYCCPAVPNGISPTASRTASSLSSSRGRGSSTGAGGGGGGGSGASSSISVTIGAGGGAGGGVVTDGAGSSSGGQIPVKKTAPPAMTNKKTTMSPACTAEMAPRCAPWTWNCLVITCFPDCSRHSGLRKNTERFEAATPPECPVMDLIPTIVPGYLRRLPLSPDHPAIGCGLPLPLFPPMLAQVDQLDRQIPRSSPQWARVRSYRCQLF